MENLRLAKRIELWPTEKLIPYVRNPRTHSEEQVSQIAASIVEFGFLNPILIDTNAGIIAGHGRLQAAKKLALPVVPVVILDHLTKTQKRAYVIADNKLALNAGWDEEALAAEMHALNSERFELALTGFDDAELEQLMAPLDDVETGNGAQDEAEETVASEPKKRVSRPGDLWQIGKHRLLCGDSTDAAAIAQLMDGEQAALLFTSPPYGNQRDYTTGGISDWDALMRGVFANAPMREDGQMLVNLGLIHKDGEWLPYWQGWLDWMRVQKWRRFGLYVWDQGAGMPGDWAGRFAPSFELVFHFNRQSRKPNKIVPCKTAGEIGHAPGTAAMRQKDGSFNAWTHGGQPTQPFRIPDSVIRIERHHGAVGTDLSHPAPFPVKLAQHVMEAYSDEGEIVFEPFCGSGTSLIAAQKLKRRVYASEIAPDYCDVTVERCRDWYPDLPITLDGISYEDVAAERLAA